jgi:hypothetical protein
LTGAIDRVRSGGRLRRRSPRRLQQNGTRCARSGSSDPRGSAPRSAVAASQPRRRRRTMALQDQQHRRAVARSTSSRSRSISARACL